MSLTFAPVFTHMNAKLHPNNTVPARKSDHNIQDAITRGMQLMMSNAMEEDSGIGGQNVGEDSEDADGGRGVIETISADDVLGGIL